jgi:hypothetical protein
MKIYSSFFGRFEREALTSRFALKKDSIHLEIRRYY